jgi:hypothetical protein
MAGWEIPKLEFIGELRHLVFERCYEFDISCIFDKCESPST